MGFGDARGERAMRGKGVGAVAAQDARHPPEGIGHYAHGAAGRGLPVERHVVVIGHARHDERSVGADGGEQPLDELIRAGSNPGERRVHQKDPARLHAEGT